MKRRTFLSQALAASGACALPELAHARAATSGRPLNLLVLGGTNFLGPAVIEAGLARGHAITTFNRGITRPKMFQEIEKLYGFRGRTENELSALAGRRRWEAVIDVWPEHSRLVEATAKLLAERADYYYFVSSIAVYRNYNEIGLDENAPLRMGEQGYGGEKAASEALVAGLYGDRFGVGRCHSIFGPRDPGSSLHYWLRRLSRHEKIAAPGSGRDPLQFIDVRDVASWIIASVEKKQLGVFNLAGPPLSFQKFLEICKQATGSTAEFEWIDRDFVYAQKIRSFDELPLWIPNSEDPGFFQISAEKARRAGMQVRPQAETIAAAWRWYQSAFFKDTQFPHNGWGIHREREEALMDQWQALDKQ